LFASKVLASREQAPAGFFENRLIAITRHAPGLIGSHLIDIDPASPR